MRLSCGDQFLGSIPREVILDRIRDLGFSAVDICVIGGHTPDDPAEIASDVRAWTDHIANLTRDRGLTITDLFVVPHLDYSRLAPNHPDEAERRASGMLFGSLLEAAQRLGSPSLTMVPGIDWEGEDHHRSLERASEELSGRTGRCAAAGIEFCIEPHVGSVVPTPEDVSTLVAGSPGLGLALDYAHFLMQHIDPAGVDPLLESTHHLHVRGAAPGNGQTSMSESTLDYTDILSRVPAGGRFRHVCIEYVAIPEGHPSSVDTVPEIAAYRDLLTPAITRKASS